MQSEYAIPISRTATNLCLLVKTCGQVDLQREIHWISGLLPSGSSPPFRSSYAATVERRRTYLVSCNESMSAGEDLWTGGLALHIEVIQPLNQVILCFDGMALSSIFLPLEALTR